MMKIKIHQLNDVNDMTEVTNLLGRVAPRGVCLIEQISRERYETVEEWTKNLWFKNISDSILERIHEDGPIRYGMSMVISAESSVECSRFDDGSEMGMSLPLVCVLPYPSSSDENSEIAAFKKIILEGLVSAVVAVGLGEDTVFVPLCSSSLCDLDPKRYIHTIHATLRRFRNGMLAFGLVLEELHFLCSKEQYEPWREVLLGD